MLTIQIVNISFVFHWTKRSCNVLSNFRSAYITYIVLHEKWSRKAYRHENDYEREWIGNQHESSYPNSYQLTSDFQTKLLTFDVTVIRQSRIVSLVAQVTVNTKQVISEELERVVTSFTCGTKIRAMLLLWWCIWWPYPSEWFSKHQTSINNFIEVDHPIWNGYIWVTNPIVFGLRWLYVIILLFLHWFVPVWSRVDFNEEVQIDFAKSTSKRKVNGWYCITNHQKKNS